MAYGTIKINNITFDNGGSDQNVTVSGLYNSLTSGVTVTGTISGSVVIGGTSVSGTTVLGTTVTGTTVQGVSGTFTSLTGATITGTTINAVTVASTTGTFTSLTGTTITGTSINGVTVTATTGSFTSLTGTTTSGTTANFVSGVFTTQISGTTVTGTTANFTSGNFTSISGGTQTVTSGVFAVASATNPSISFASDPNTGIYSPGADQVAISTNGTGRLFVASDGNVGIGGAAAGAFRLDVIGSGIVTRQSTAGDQGILLLKGNAGTTAGATIESSFSAGGYGPLIFNTNNSEVARFTQTGRLGLGTSSPGANLDIKGTTSRIRVDTNNAYTLLTHANEAFSAFATSISNAADHQFQTAGIERLRITSTGLVGIGTTSPGSALEINAAAATSPFIAKINTAEAARIDSSGRLLVGTSSARTNFFNSTVSAELQLETPNATSSVVRNANDANHAVFILGKSRGSSNVAVNAQDGLGLISFQGNDGTEFVDAARIAAEVDGTPGANDMPGRLVFSTTADGAASPTEAMRINNAGELLIGYTADNGAYKLQVNSQIFATSAIIATSDGRYKENVASLGGCLDLVKALRPVSFTWKPQEDITRTDDEGNEVLVREGHNFPEGTQVGFIAQEVQEVLTDKPWLNSVIKENVRSAVLDGEGNELAPEEQFYGIAEGNLIAVLTNALQEAVAQIETLTDRVAALEGE